MSQSSTKATRLVAMLLLLAAGLVAAKLGWITPTADNPRTDATQQRAGATNSKHETAPDRSQSAPPTASEHQPETPTDEPSPPANSPLRTEAATPSYTIEDVSIRNLDGRVVYQGTIDLAPTLKRIAAGAKLDHRNDGSTFQNREGRLPKKPAGYYQEWVHPTPGLAGPGPQRVVTGADGEAYYTSDHYRTFQRIR